VHLDIALKSGVWVEPSKFFVQISEAGYEARKNEVRLTLTGKITQEDDRLLLILDDVKPGPQKFLLAQGESKNEKEAQTLAEAFRKIEGLVGQTVELEGVWQPPTDRKEKSALSRLFVRRVARIEADRRP
jgi:hypothetical protein